MKNPWLELGQKMLDKKFMSKKDKEFVAEGDKESIDKINEKIQNGSSKHKGKYIIDPKILPEPFWGDLENANVYILSGNPGLGDDEIVFNDNPDLVEATRRSITQNDPYIVWLDPAKPPIKNGEKIHNGHDYWIKKTKVLREAANPGNLNICIIEYFPYHSMKISSAMKTIGSDMPSSKFANECIEKAINNDNKQPWIVIARCKKEWLDRIEGLKEYGKKSGRVLITRSQQMYLTPRNLQKIDESVSLADNKSSTWDDFVEACKK